MNILNYSLTALASYIGLFMGFILALIAKEEIKPGKKYFLFLQKAILSAIFIILFIFLDLNYIAILLLLACIIIYITKKKKEFNDTIYTYILLSVIFYLSSRNINLFIIEAPLIFFYGLPTGTLLTTKDKKQTTINILKHISFVLIAIILFLIF
jgi:hypothetical protein